MDGLLQMRSHNVCVDLSSPDIGVAQHGLNATKIGTAFQKVRGKSMPEDVRTESLVDAGFFAVDPQEFPEVLTGHPCPACGHK